CPAGPRRRRSHTRPPRRPAWVAPQTAPSASPTTRPPKTPHHSVEPVFQASSGSPLFTGVGAPPPTRTDADASLGLPLALAQHGRRRSYYSLALGPHPQ